MTAEDTPESDESTVPAENYIEMVNQTAVERRLTDIEAAFDEVPVTERTFHLSAEEYADVFAATQGTGFAENSVIFPVRSADEFPDISEDLPEQAAADTRDRALLVLGRGADLWALPGGGEGVEFESMQGTALRRLNEQTGVRSTISGVAEVVHSKYYPDTDAEGSVHTLDVYFRGEYAKGSIDIDESELTGAAWFAEPPERLTDGAQKVFETFLDESADE